MDTETILGWIMIGILVGMIVLMWIMVKYDL